MKGSEMKYAIVAAMLAFSLSFTPVKAGWYCSKGEHGISAAHPCEWVPRRVLRNKYANVRLCQKGEHGEGSAHPCKIP
jgi:hypothetical protein